MFGGDMPLINEIAFSYMNSSFIPQELKIFLLLQLHHAELRFSLSNHNKVLAIFTDACR